MLIAICLAAKFGLLPLSAGTRVVLIFALLIALMLTGMPVSIALGLTVLIFLFTLTDVPIEAVALKLFTGIERFEIMAIPFFILAGNFLTHGGVATTNDRFRHLADRALARRTGPRRHRRLRDVCAGLRIERRYGGGHRLDHPAGDGETRLSDALRRRHHHGCAGSLGILMLPSIPKVIYAIVHQHLDRRAVRGGPVAGHVAHDHALHRHLVHRQNARNYPRMQKATWGARPASHSARASGG